MTTDQNAADDRPLVILHTAPQPVDRIFAPDALVALNERFTVVDLEQVDNPAAGSTNCCRRRSRSSANRI